MIWVEKERRRNNFLLTPKKKGWNSIQLRANSAADLFSHLSAHFFSLKGFFLPFSFSSFFLRESRSISHHLDTFFIISIYFHFFFPTFLNKETCANSPFSFPFFLLHHSHVFFLCHSFPSSFSLHHLHVCLLLAQEVTWEGSKQKS